VVEEYYQIAFDRPGENYQIDFCASSPVRRVVGGCTPSMTLH
jgi:hypothetical protein